MTIIMPPAVSIIVPVLNEGTIIRQTVSHLTEAGRKFNAEIIIVDADPAGSTICHVDLSQVRKLVGARGRARQMNAGAKVAGAGVLLFVHADTRLPESAINKVLDVCRRPAIAGGAFLLGIDHPGKFYRLAECWANLRGRLTRIPYGDQAVFIKKRVFRDLGGYAPIAIMEDIEIMQRLKRRGLKIRLIEKYVQTSARRWEQEGLIYGMVRNTILSSLYYAGVNPSVLKRFYK